MPRRRARSTWGSNEDAGNGRRRLRYWADLHDGRGYTRHSMTIVGSRRDGDETLARLRVEHSQDRPTPTVGELWSRFELPRLRDGNAAGTTSDRTLALYSRVWERDVAPRWSGVPATDVRPIDVQDWLLTKTKSMGELSKAVLRLTLDHAVMLDVIAANPAARRYRLGEDTRRDEGAYTPVQLGELWQVVRGSVAEVPFLLSAHAGLRVGEACAVRLSDVTWRDDGAALVRVRVQLTPGGEVTDRLKTAASRRTVGLPDPWASRLREIADALPNGAVYLNDSGCGEPVPRKTVNDWWRRLVKASDVPYRSMQVLRPSFQTALHWAGVPIEQTSRMLGHATPSTTLAHYDRPDGDAVANVMIECARNRDSWDKLGQTPKTQAV